MPPPSQLFIPSGWEKSAGLPLLCFPYAGGSPFAFLEWQPRLQPEIQVVALQAPGHGARFFEHPHSSVQDIVEELVQNFPAFEGRPFAFYGHSLGAILALELAWRLRKENLPQPYHLFVGAARPPQMGPTQPALHRLPDADFLVQVQARYSGIPEEIFANPDILSAFLPTLRADFAVYETYAHHSEAPLDCPISAFAGRLDSAVPAKLMEGWGAHTRAQFKLRELPGDHFFLTESQEELTGSIRHALTAQP